MPTIVWVLLVLVAAVIGALAGFSYFKNTLEKKIGRADKYAKELLDDATRKAVRKMVDTAHLRVAFGGQPMLLSTGLNINDLDETRRQAAVALLKQGIDQATELGAF